MRRTQIYLDEHVDEQLRQRAASEGSSAAAVIRQALDAYLARTSPATAGEDPIRAMAGTLGGMPADASVEHDRDLYGAPRSAGTHAG
ncbi:MAG: ribbon-helix-helix protein, CopG family [Acidimicrobiales bacterium]